LLGVRIQFSREARGAFLRFAGSSEATWPGNFRDFGGAVLRMATLADGGRVDSSQVQDEIGRLRTSWATATPGTDEVEAILERYLDKTRIAALDRFDVVQLADVLRVCERSRTLSEAGRALFAASRQRRRSTNDTDRLRKYLARFGIAWKRS
jgi:transcriptional regulatory protein RtcR